MCKWIYRSRAWCIQRFWSPHCCWCSASFIFLTLHIKRSKTDQALLPSGLRGVRTGKNSGYSWLLCQPTSHPHFFSFLTACPLPTRASSPLVYIYYDSSASNPLKTVAIAFEFVAPLLCLSPGCLITESNWLVEATVTANDATYVPPPKWLPRQNWSNTGYQISIR